jgi:hypothetical protein
MLYLKSFTSSNLDNALLAQADGKRLEVRRGEMVTVEFAGLSIKPGARYSLIVRGYYVPITNPTGR